jgi:chromate reductase
MEKKIKILGIAGSLRKESYNRSLLRVAFEVAPSNCILEVFDLQGIPLYNQDEETHLPPAVAALKAKVRAADAILISTPEYNYSIPGVLKNALDWGSRPYGESAWDNKTVAIMGASMGLQGTSRAQYHLRQVFVYLNMHPLNQPELMVGIAQDKFDAEGNLTDPKTRKKVGELLTALIAAAKHRTA